MRHKTRRHVHNTAGIQQNCSYDNAHRCLGSVDDAVSGRKTPSVRDKDTAADYTEEEMISHPTYIAKALKLTMEVGSCSHADLIWELPKSRCTTTSRLNRKLVREMKV